MLINMPEDS